MQLTILGSGGFLPTPLPTCHCRLCLAARKTPTLKRRGPAIFLPEDKILIDTPEDVSDSLNAANVKDVRAIFYTHWHPDHTLGFRVIEALRDLEFSPKKKPIDIYIPEFDLENVKRIIPALWYFADKGHAKIRPLTAAGVTIGKTKIKPFRLDETTFAGYEIRRAKKFAVLCPDHCKHLPAIEKLQHPDLLLMNLGFIEHNIKGGKDLPKNHRIRTLTSLSDNVRHLEFYQPKKAVLMHIEERWNKTHDELKQIIKALRPTKISIATDGLKINI